MLAVSANKMPPEIIILVILIAFFGFLLRMFFTRRAEVERYLKRVPLRKISDFGNGDHGKIVGRALMAGNYFEAPLSGRRCMYYRIVVEEYRRRTKSISGHWVTIIDVEEAAHVVMTDGKDYAIVEAENAKGYLVPDKEYRTRWYDKSNPRLREFLSWHNHSDESLWGFTRTLRCREGVLSPNEKFVVSGTGEWRDAKEFEFDLPCTRILVIKPGEGATVHLSDDPMLVNHNSQKKITTG